VVEAIPLALKRAIGVGIGLFILFIGLYSGGLVKQGTGIPVTLGDLTSPSTLVAVLGVVLTTALMALRFQGALLVGIVLTTVVAIGVNTLTGGKAFPTPGMAVIPSQLVALPDFSTFGAGLNFSVFARVGLITAVMTIFTIMLSDFFDTMGTVIGVGGEGGWLDARSTPAPQPRAPADSSALSEVSRAVLLQRISRAPLVWRSVGDRVTSVAAVDSFWRCF
jgi:AGZA family xanthine/uracil permease-like MFS transporter